MATNRQKSVIYAGRKLFALTCNLLRISRANPSGLRHVLGVALSGSNDVVDAEADVRSLPEITVAELLGEQPSVRAVVEVFNDGGAAISGLECIALSALMVANRCRRVFEFGTYKGISTTQLALNLAPGGTVFTIDLPEGDSRYRLNISSPEEQRLTKEAGKGQLVPEDLLARVTFLRMDSAEFDPAPFLESIDLAFVDGAHSYDYVKNDSLKAWQMLRPGGWLVWHDCNPRHGDVVRFLRHFPCPVNRVAGTDLALSRKPESQ